MAEDCSLAGVGAGTWASAGIGADVKLADAGAGVGAAAGATAAAGTRSSGDTTMTVAGAAAGVGNGASTILGVCCPGGVTAGTGTSFCDETGRQNRKDRQ